MVMMVDQWLVAMWHVKDTVWGQKELGTARYTKNAHVHHPPRKVKKQFEH
jgi:hypothetical protein